MNFSSISKDLYACNCTSTDNEAFRRGMLQATAIFMLLVAIFGSLFNSMFIYILLEQSIRKSRTNIYVITLCVASILIAVFIVPSLGISSLADNWVFGEHGCILHGFAMTALGLFQIFILTVMSFEKYIIMAKKSWERLLSRTGTTVTIIGCSIIGLFLGSCPLIGWNSYKLEEQKTACAIDWSDRSPSALCYTVLLMFIGLVIPVSIMIFSYVNIFLVIRGHRHKLHQTLRSNGKCYENMLKREIKVIKTMFILVCAFVFSWLPYSAISLYAVFDDVTKVNPVLGMLPALFAKASVIWNPIIYMFINQSYKKVLKEKLSLYTPAACACCHCKCIRRGDNTATVTDTNNAVHGSFIIAYHE
ncbi:visual pigment-like receptor peropsin [Mizuhopecten yessoensis]|uniref:Rhodopsin, GQ-coupled n=1 Tax=Mizuhopecten yessoensis TaxID=6573 RepID=A0A210QKM1_MIZYE|nr:visual pigment-like receptor peropsin [Mizuhopecten yessoensis]OWF49303.1 Rhodopsin, GQ-coupled [Mizuhopecten yessoensis]